ncbi:MAG TPA: hypothetical protein VF556_06140 [Pyrinomonadaceae bacterium]
MMKKIAFSHKRNKLLRAFRLKMIFTAYRKTAETEEILKQIIAEEDKSEEKRIRCPHCKWQPSKSSRWFCADCDYPEYFYGGCFTSWNTFDTGGICPGCAHRWIWTSCLRCAEWSRHVDWYENDI